MEKMPTELLQCPVCTAQMRLDDGGSSSPGALACESGHRFDRARQGYFNLLTGRGSSFVPDTAAMVNARTGFLGAGHYDRLASAVADAAARAVQGRANPAVLDAGAGTGYYLEHVLRSIPSAHTVAMDISKYALRRAARSVPAAVCAVWDIWRPLPVRSGAIDVVVNIFAPRNAEEFARVLSPGGRLIVVTPLPGHLEQIRSAASLLEVAPEKGGQLNRTVEEHFVPEQHLDIDIGMDLSRDDIRLAAMMGPAAHHLDQATLDQSLQDLPSRTPVTAAFRLSVYSLR